MIIFVKIGAVLYKSLRQEMELDCKMLNHVLHDQQAGPKKINYFKINPR